MSRVRQTWTAGIGLGAIGAVCLAGGLILLGWRLLAPDDAVILPPRSSGTVEPTPTPGVLGTPLPPPALPAAADAVAILPVSELLSPTPATQHASPTQSPARTRTPRPPDAVPTAVPLTSPISATPVVAFTATAGPGITPRTASPAAVAPAPTPTAAPSGEPPVHIRIPRIGLDAPIVPVGQHPLILEGQLYSQWDVPPARVVGWHQTSAPLGIPGNTVLNGHHNIAGEVFRYLAVLKPGDRITLESATRRYHYVVAQTMTLAEEGQPLAVRAENARWILPTADERVTLITCWPYTSNTHRLVVIALPLWSVIPPGDIP